MRPIIGVTMGDAAGIGPEIIAKALSIREIYELCRPIVIGDAHVIKETVKIIGVDTRVNSLHDIGKAKFDFGTIDVLDMSNIDLSNLRVGQVDAMAGKAAVQYVETAVRLALDGKIHAIATAPINKEAISIAGCPYAGHTELLAHLTDTRNYAMMLIVGSLRVVHVTTHVSMRKACDMIKKRRVFDVIQLANQALLRMGTKKPRIAVASFNPHAGEGGLFGTEEIEEIKPAVDLARIEGLDVLGPFPPDTVFVKARGGAYDAVVAMYHDQGHIPVKLLGLEWNEKEGRWTSVTGINVTIGLPIMRSSVDHGTAFGKAWKGTANPQSMIEAIRFAASVA